VSLSEGQLWLAILALALMTAVTKAVGPALVGGRPLPRWASGVIGAMAPALLAALVVTAVFADGQRLDVGAHTVGVGAATVLVVLRAPLLLAVLVAVVVTAGLRALF
jgi:branched-subunit amino acid transport protein